MEDKQKKKDKEDKEFRIYLYGTKASNGNQYHDVSSKICDTSKFLTTVCGHEHYQNQSIKKILVPGTSVPAIQKLGEYLQEINFSEIDYSVGEKQLGFIEQVPKKLLKDLYSAASYLQINSLKDLCLQRIGCETYLYSKVTKSKIQEKEKNEEQDDIVAPHALLFQNHQFKQTKDTLAQIKDLQSNQNSEDQINDSLLLVYCDQLKELKTKIDQESDQSVPNIKKLIKKLLEITDQTFQILGRKQKLLKQEFKNASKSQDKNDEGNQTKELYQKLQSLQIKQEKVLQKKQRWNNGQYNLDDDVLNQQQYHKLLQEQFQEMNKTESEKVIKVLEHFNESPQLFITHNINLKYFCKMSEHMKGELVGNIQLAKIKEEVDSTYLKFFLQKKNPEQADSEFEKMYLNVLFTTLSGMPKNQHELQNLNNKLKNKNKALMLHFYSNGEGSQNRQQVQIKRQINDVNNLFTKYNDIKATLEDYQQPYNKYEYKLSNKQQEKEKLLNQINEKGLNKQELKETIQNMDKKIEKYQYNMNIVKNFTMEKINGLNNDYKSLKIYKYLQ